MELSRADEHHAWLRGQALVRYYEQSESDTFGSTVYIRSRPPHLPAPQGATALTLANLFDSASRSLSRKVCADFLDVAYFTHGVLFFSGLYTSPTLYFQVHRHADRSRAERIAYNITVLHHAMNRYTLLLGEASYKHNPDSGESNHGP